MNATDIIVKQLIDYSFMTVLNAAFWCRTYRRLKTDVNWRLYHVPWTEYWRDDCFVSQERQQCSSSARWWACWWAWYWRSSWPAWWWWLLSDFEHTAPRQDIPSGIIPLRRKSAFHWELTTRTRKMTRTLMSFRVIKVEYTACHSNDHTTAETKFSPVRVIHLRNNTNLIFFYGQWFISCTRHCESHSL